MRWFRMGAAFVLLMIWALRASTLHAGEEPEPTPERPATQPSSAPADATMDWLLGQATTAPATTAPATTDPRADPSSRPASPFAPVDFGERRGVIELSDGEKVRGTLHTTQDKPVRVWEEQTGTLHDLPFALIKSMEAQVVWERDEREWHFKEAGSDIKEYSGKTYPARDTRYVVTLVNGQQITGEVAVPLYLDTKDGSITFILHKRDKGELGQSLKQLVYVKRVDLKEAEKKPVPASKPAAENPSTPKPAPAATGNEDR